MRHRAWTLTELLVVLAVLGLVLSVLLPALGRARGQARMVSCQARLHQWGMAVRVYAADADGWLALDPNRLGPSHVNGYTGQWVENPHQRLLASLRGYIGDRRLWFCPGWRQPPYAYRPEAAAAGEISYFYFSVAQQPVTNGGLPTFLFSPRKSDPMTYPRHLRTSQTPGTWVGSDFWFSGRVGAVPTAHLGYGKGINRLRLDGAVHTIRAHPRQSFE